MGKTQSKNVDNNGPMSNTILIEQQDVRQSALLIVLVLILLVQVILLIYKCYSSHRRGLRKMYASRNIVNV